MPFNLDLDRAVTEIKKHAAKTVCIQLADALKPRAGEIKEYLSSQTGATVVIYAGSCFGACDLPLEVEKLGVDLLIAWGHTSYPWVLD